jgi:hypothetical protein
LSLLMDLLSGSTLILVRNKRFICLVRSCRREKMQEWMKGVVFVNGFALGKYADIGPQ